MQIKPIYNLRYVPNLFNPVTDYINEEAWLLAIITKYVSQLKNELCCIKYC